MWNALKKTGVKTNPSPAFPHPCGECSLSTKKSFEIGSFPIPRPLPTEYRASRVSCCEQLQPLPPKSVRATYFVVWNISVRLEGPLKLFSKTVLGDTAVYTESMWTQHPTPYGEVQLGERLYLSGQACLGQN